MLSQLEEGTAGFGEQRPEMLLKSLQETAQAPTTRNHPTPKVNSAQVEKPHADDVFSVFRFHSFVSLSFRERRRKLLPTPACVVFK